MRSIGKMFDRFNAKAMLLDKHGHAILSEYTIVKAARPEKITVSYRDEGLLISAIVDTCKSNFDCAYVYRTVDGDNQESYHVYVADHGSVDMVQQYTTRSAFIGNYVIYALAGTLFSYSVDSLDNDDEDDL